MRSLKKEIDLIDDALSDLRKTVERNQPKTVTLPIAAVHNSDPDTMTLKLGEWCPSYWPGMMVMLTHEDPETESKYVLCQVEEPMDLGAHRHEGHVEEIYMIEGQMRDVIHDQTIRTGGKIKSPAGEAHWPVFDGPALLMVVFRRLAR